MCLYKLCEDMCRVEVELNFGITLCHFSDGAEKMKKKKIHIYKENIYVSQLQFIPIAKFGFLLKVKKKSAPEVMLRLFLKKCNAFGFFKSP